jgi:microcystin-dependent protein
MGQPYVGEIRIFAGNFAPAGWALCLGQSLAIADNDVLFALIGTTYGGDGQQTFNLPDLRGRVPIHQGNGFVIGQSAGTETSTLTLNQIPAHSHAVPALTGANAKSPSATVYGGNTAYSLYDAAPSVQMNAGVVGVNNPGNQPHANMMPILTINYIISLFGVFPSQG